MLYVCRFCATWVHFSPETFLCFGKMRYRTKHIQYCLNMNSTCFQVLFLLLLVLIPEIKLLYCNLQILSVSGNSFDTCPVLCLSCLYNAPYYVTLVTIYLKNKEFICGHHTVKVAYKMHLLASIRSLRWKLTSVILKT